nr:MAG TPA: hypothetical protein [Caudoviricetes sp.]
MADCKGYSGGDGDCKQNRPTEAQWEDQDYQKGEKMSEKTEVKVPEEIRTAWNEVRFCADLLREGKAKIMVAIRKDGTAYRYTKPK